MKFWVSAFMFFMYVSTSCARCCCDILQFLFIIPVNTNSLYVTTDCSGTSASVISIYSIDFGEIHLFSFCSPVFSEGAVVLQHKCIRVP